MGVSVIGVDAKAWLLVLLFALLSAPASARDCNAPRIKEARAVPLAEKGELTLATQNLWRLFDDVDDGPGDVVPPRRYRQRLDKLSRQVIDVLRVPDVLAVQEAENLKVLNDLAAVVAARSGRPPYQAVLVEGRDRGGIDVGFLVRADWEIVAVEPLLAKLRRGRAPLFDRPPLWLRLRLPDGKPLELVNVHLKSLRGNDDSPEEAARIAGKRRQQAEALAGWFSERLQTEPGARLVLLGDFNAGIAGAAAMGGVDVLGLLAAAGLKPLDERLPEAERYSYVHECHREALDHVLVTQALLPAVRGLAASRGNAGVSWRFDREDATALHSADHDGLVLYLKP